MERRGEDVYAGGAVFQTGHLALDAPPALKGGVTTNSALQARYIFQMFNDDKIERDCCLPFEVLQQPLN